MVCINIYIYTVHNIYREREREKNLSPRKNVVVCFHQNNSALPKKTRMAPFSWNVWQRSRYIVAEQLFCKLAWELSSKDSEMVVYGMVVYGLDSNGSRVVKHGITFTLYIHVDNPCVA